MDPNTNLAYQLELARSILDDDDYLDTGDAIELAELVLALNDWIIQGGFLPRQWRANS